MSQTLVPLVGACATWLDQAFGPGDSAMATALVQVQTRQAVTVAAWLRFPTELDAALALLTAPGGTGGLDALSAGGSGQPWRSWVDETIVSWAACLLVDTDLARGAVAKAGTTEHAQGLCLSFRSLLAPSEREARAAALLRHPDLAGPVAALHRPALLTLLTHGSVSGS